jgi:hypothetical protein
MKGDLPVFQMANLFAACQISNRFYETISPPGFGFQGIYWPGREFTSGPNSFIINEERKYPAVSKR